MNYATKVVSLSCPDFPASAVTGITVKKLISNLLQKMQTGLMFRAVGKMTDQELGRLSSAGRASHS